MTPPAKPCSAESVADLSSMDGMSLGRRNTGSSNNMARNVSTRSLGLTSAPGSSLSKLESIASTAVRAADKVGVRATPAALPAAVRPGQQSTEESTKQAQATSDAVSMKLRPCHRRRRRSA